MSMVSYLIHYDSLLQNATDIIAKPDSRFITVSVLLQHVSVLLQNATVITKCDDYYKLRYNAFSCRLLIRLFSCFV